MQLRAYTLIALTAALITSCERTHPNYCPTATNHNCLELDADVSCHGDPDCAGRDNTPVCDIQGSQLCVQCTTSNPGACTGTTPACGAGNVCVQCTMSQPGACTGTTPVCGADNVCVQCTTSQPGACTGTTPVCGADTTCHRCSAHSQCGSSVCLPDGSCASDTNVAYVSPGGTDGTCSKSAPCKTLDAALQRGRAYVKMATGLVKDMKTTTIDGQSVTILADADAQLDRDGDGPVLEVTGATAVVRIYDLKITGAAGAAGADGIRLTANGGNPTLELTRVVVDGNQGNGIVAAGGVLTVTQSSIANNQGNGITAAGGALTVTQSSIANNQAAGLTISGGTLSLSRSVISANQGGGVIMTGSGTLFIIKNNFIYRNGNGVTASAGGLSLLPTGASSLEFNTIVDNQAKVAGTSAGGVFCDEPGFTAAHNLIFRNTGGASGNVQTVGVCSYGDSFSMPGTSTVDNAPGFAHPNALPFDYHLTATSPTSIVDAAGACTGVDFDSDTRPIGAACDLGADERQP